LQERKLLDARRRSATHARRAVRGEEPGGETRLARGVQQRKVQDHPEQLPGLQATGGGVGDAEQTAGNPKLTWHKYSVKIHFQTCTIF